jgi:hypothetical protein
MGIHLLAGRSFIEGSASHQKDAFILDESAIRQLGWHPEDAIGKSFSMLVPPLEALEGGGEKWRTGKVFLAVVLSILIAHIAMSRWLNNFAYHIELSWLIFAVSGFLALVIAVTTVSYQAITAAKADPAESIRYE